MANTATATTSKALAAALLALAMCACRQAPREPVTLSYFRLGWSQPDELPAAGSLSQQFTQKTGIQLKSLPVPENTLDQMALSRQLLEQGASGPDVLGVDLIWSGLLEDYLLDLRPYLATEISALEPELLSSYVVGHKVVAIPYQMQVGVLEYRIATTIPRKRGTSWRAWPSGSRPVSAPGVTRTFGVTSGRGQLRSR
jgi:trehalose/maltose transport system substrate-binding protein